MARIFNIACLIVAEMFVFTNANEYCKIECKNLFDGSIHKHTMCMYPSPNLGAACHKPHSVGLSAEEKTAILQKHNELRRRVASGKETRGKPGPQPPAVDMPDLIWDTELETIAQRWANQCIYGHDKCNKVKRFNVGQNIAYEDVPGENKTPVEDFVQGWYDEVDDFDSKLVPNFQPSGKIVLHYTQMIWAETKNIGCGRIKYNVNSLDRHYLVCNYGPRGNLVGSPVYKIKK